MAEFQWWLLIVGLVAGGGLVAIVSADSRRREEDLADLERLAEATWISDRLASLDAGLDARTVESVLRIHREYLSLPPPDRLVVEGGAETEGDAPALGDRDPDRDPDEIGDDGSSRPDQDLSRT
ncbi:MAG: hypothetical protein HYX55_06405 [Chloroflexi bacterium]|nr:hypothetical protein [Chloroflexota bacterium]